MKRSVIFDLDGVLVDSEPLYERAFRAGLTTVGRADLAGWFPHTLGRRQADFIDELATLAAIPPTTLSRAMRDAMSQLLSDGAAVPRMPGVPDAVHAIAEGRPVALASSSTSGFVARVLEAIGLDDVLSVRATGDEVAAGKPDPELYLLAAHRRGVHPARCVAIEDTPAGVQSALAADMTAIAVPNGMTADMRFATEHVAADLDAAFELVAQLDERPHSS